MPDASAQQSRAPAKKRARAMTSGDNEGTSEMTISTVTMRSLTNLGINTLKLRILHEKKRAEAENALKERLEAEAHAWAAKEAAEKAIIERILAEELQAKRFASIQEAVQSHVPEVHHQPTIVPQQVDHHMYYQMQGGYDLPGGGGGYIDGSNGGSFMPAMYSDYGRGHEQTSGGGFYNGKARNSECNGGWGGYEIAQGMSM